MIIVLASSSPRRKELLHNILNDFILLPNDAPEIKCGAKPSQVVMTNAQNKAKAYEGDGLVISADTVVYMANKFYLKPVSKDDAYRMLKSLSGHIHYVYTGVCLRYGNKEIKFYDKSNVTLKKMSDNEIWNYINTGSPLDKAGAYGIQDNFVVEKYNGSYTNIMGLPLEKLKLALADFGVSTLD